MSVDQYVELFRARNGFSRQRMDAQVGAAFDVAFCDLDIPFAGRGVLTFDETAHIIWEQPLTGERAEVR
jgi:hypothetical protein